MKNLVIHSTLTEEDFNISGESIAQSHVDDDDLKICSFQDVIKLDGTIESLVQYNPNRIDNWIYKEDYESLKNNSRHIGYVGGVVNGFTRNTISRAQKKSLGIYIKYMLLRFPDLNIVGYSKVSGYDSEGFNVSSFLKEIKTDLVLINL